MTVFDPLEDEGAETAAMSHLAARQEYRTLVAALNLPLDRAVEPLRLSA
jgi:chromosome partitioning protein